MNGRTFAGVRNSSDGDVGQSTIFTYHEEETVIWAEYSGVADGRIRLHESWAWESRPGTGTSIVEELKSDCRAAR